MTLPVRFAAFLLFSLIAATTLAQYQPQVGQADRVAVLVGELEVGSGLAGLDHATDPTGRRPRAGGATSAAARGGGP